MDLNKITDPSFVKELDFEQLNSLSEDVRAFLIENISKTGGHLSSNLGIVELTIALHYVFDSPEDKIFFDVGHQSYVHKILTGRANKFDTLRKYQGLSGFQKRHESIHDVWEAGHSSTALSAAVGMAVSRDLDNDHYNIIPVIGDAAIVGGESLEALNHLGSLDSKVIIILNDNQMAIGKSVGGFNDFLSSIRISDTYNNMKNDYKSILNRTKFGRGIYHATKVVKDFIKHGFMNDTIFEDFGINYLGPVDGHDFNDLIRVLKLAKNNEKSVVVHVMTKKGKGYKFAEEDTTGKWHGIEPFNIEDGTLKNKKDPNLESWSSVVSSQVEYLMKNDKDIVTVTPAMISGSALSNIFQKYPTRSYDVGIAEEHAMTFCAGLSINNKKPFLSVYSSFFQRCYDQLNHDIARMNLPCLISIDRSGLVGSDGPTHHGVFDIGLINAIPNVVFFSGKDGKEVRSFINTAFKDFTHPYILRIPRGSTVITDKCDDVLQIGTWIEETNQDDYDMTLITYGSNVNQVIERLEKENIKVRIINARFIKPMDYCMLDKISKDNKPLLVYETDLKTNSLGSNISYYYSNLGINKEIMYIGINDRYVTQGDINKLFKVEEIDLDTVVNQCVRLINEERKN